MLIVLALLLVAWFAVDVVAVAVLARMADRRRGGPSTPYAPYGRRHTDWKLE